MKKEIVNGRNGSKNREPKCSHYHGQIDEYAREEEQVGNQRMVILRNNHILTFGEVSETSLTSWNSFNVCLAHTLLQIADRPKSMCATSTNSNTRVACRFIELHVRHTL